MARSSGWVRLYEAQSTDGALTALASRYLRYVPYRKVHCRRRLGLIVPAVLHTGGLADIGSADTSSRFPKYRYRWDPSLDCQRFEPLRL
jgi:hypothetical protein